MKVRFVAHVGHLRLFPTWGDNVIVKARRSAR